jgi:hypothetical protein
MPATAAPRQRLTGRVAVIEGQGHDLDWPQSMDTGQQHDQPVLGPVETIEQSGQEVPVEGQDGRRVARAGRRSLRSG